jgi:hypothetical protein
VKQLARYDEFNVVVVVKSRLLKLVLRYEGSRYGWIHFTASISYDHSAPASIRIRVDVKSADLTLRACLRGLDHIFAGLYRRYCKYQGGLLLFQNAAAPAQM